jgi:hypothetical protein
MPELRYAPSGKKVDLDALIAPLLAPYLLKSGVNIGRFIPSAFSPGSAVRAFVSKASGPADWTVENFNTIKLPLGKYLVLFNGVLSKLDTVSVQLALASTSGGVNMAGFNIPASPAYSQNLTMVGAWNAASPVEELWFQATSTGAAPTLANSNIYVIGLGPLT